MEYAWLIYLATRLDSIHSFTGYMTTLMFVMFVVTVCGICAALASDKETMDTTIAEQVATNEKIAQKFRPWRNWSMVLFFVFSFAYALVPTKKDAMYIAAGVATWEAGKAIAGSTIAKTSVSLIEEWLNKELGEVRAKTPASKEEPKKVEPKVDNKEAPAPSVKDKLVGAVKDVVVDEINKR